MQILLLVFGCAPNAEPVPTAGSEPALEPSFSEGAESDDASVVKVVAGTGFGCTLDEAGAVVCSPTTDLNEEGALPCAHFWVQEKMRAGLVARNIAASRDTLCVVSVRGELSCSPQTDGFGATPGGAYLDVAVGHGQACALAANGNITCWGTPRDSVAGVHEGPYIGVSSSGFAACGLRAEGDVDCWGETAEFESARMEGPFTSISGMCGRGIDGIVECWSGDPHPLWSEPMRTFATGTATCGIDSTGRLRCATDFWEPSTAAMPLSDGFVQVSVDEGGQTACALHGAGTPSCWGSRRMGCYKNPNW